VPTAHPARYTAAVLSQKIAAGFAGDLGKALAESREFAKGGFTTALHGRALSADEKQKSSSNFPPHRLTSIS